MKGLRAAPRPMRAIARSRQRSEPQHPERGGRRPSVREAILEAARALYARGGYAVVTMREIADQLGIKAPSLYHHFVGKDDIFAALQERAFELQLETELRLRPVADPLEDLKQFFWRYYEFSKVHPDYFALAYVDPAAPPLQRHVYELNPLRGLDMLAVAKFRRCIDAGIFPKTTDEHIAGQMLWATMHGPAALRVIHHQHVYDFDQVASQALEVAIAGIRAGALPVGAPRLRMTGAAQTTSTPADTRPAHVNGVDGSST